MPAPARASSITKVSRKAALINGSPLFKRSKLRRGDDRNIESIYTSENVRLFGEFTILF
jgi:hypothetical protein